jgi:hypothetical protein
MAYIDSYKYDIFISYAHVDNAQESDEEMGWVAQFHKKLDIALSQRMGRMDAVKIWWDDRKLDGSTVFDQSIEEGLKHSAIMVCLMSNGYMKSDYCQKELDIFYQKAQQEKWGLKVGDRSRILNVLLYNIPFQKWPTELTGTSGFPLYEADDPNDWGNPLQVEDPRFRKQMHDLREALANIIEQMKEATTTAPVEQEETGFSIFFGDVADSLRSVRKRTITELEKQGYKIICDVPPPFEKDEHEQAVKQKIEGTALHVHLLDQFPGREIEDEEGLWYPQRQVEIGLQSEKPQLIWVPAETNIEIIEEEQYKTFMQALESGQQTKKKIDFARGAKSELTQQIVDLVEQLKKEQEQAAMAQETAAASLAVLLDTHLSDQLYAWKVGESLLENGIQPYINPVEDNPTRNANTWEERISQVSKMIFFYGKVTWDWVRARMNAALQSIVTNDYAVEEFIVFMVPPHKDPHDITIKQRVLKLNVVNNSDTPQLNTTALQQFIQNIKRASA